MSMTKERKGEIALLCMKKIMRDKGVRLGKNSRREIGNEADSIGISIEEMSEFAEGMVLELMAETFGKKEKREKRSILGPAFDQ